MLVVEEEVVKDDDALDDAEELEEDVEEDDFPSDLLYEGWFPLDVKDELS